MSRRRVHIAQSEASALTWVVNMGVILTADHPESFSRATLVALDELQVALVAHAARRIYTAPLPSSDFIELTPSTLRTLPDIIALTRLQPTLPSANAAWLTSSAIMMMEIRTLQLPRHVNLLIEAEPEASSPALLLAIAIQWWSRAAVSILLEDVLA